MDRQTLKSNAKSQISGQIGKLFLVNFDVVLISFAVNLIPILGSFVSTFIVTPALNIGVTMIYLDVANNYEFRVGDVYNGFNKFWGAFKVTFLVGFFTFMWSLLFVIPGIIKSFSYSMAMYVMAEEKDIGAIEAINRSKKMMEGHKMEAFVLGLSFIGWILLGIVTLGIAFIYVIPYMETTMANFYNSIKEPVRLYADEIGIETKPFENN